MQVSQKCQYALRAIFELARRNGRGPITIAHIAESQAIPARFLEQILSQLRQGGFVESRRGTSGGYLLSRVPADLSVGEVIRFIEGPLGPVQCTSGQTECPLNGGCVFLAMWEKAQEAVANVYDSTAFQDLVDQDMQMRGNEPLNYAI